MVVRMVNAIARTTIPTVAGFGAMGPLLAALGCAMSDFGGAKGERCVSYVTLRRLSKKCRGPGHVGDEKAPAIAGRGKLSRAGRHQHSAPSHSA